VQQCKRKSYVFRDRLDWETDSFDDLRYIYFFLRSLDLRSRDWIKMSVTIERYIIDKKFL